MRTLISWIGDNDLAAMATGDDHDRGAIADFLAAERCDHAVLLHNRGSTAARYCGWVSDHFRIETELIEVRLTRPHDFDAVYDGARDSVLAKLHGSSRVDTDDLLYLLSSGTKAMSSALLLIACSDLPGAVYFNWKGDETTKPADRIVRVRWPDRFSLKLFAMRRQTQLDDQPLRDHRGREISSDRRMKEVYRSARRVGATSYPVLILGETGTGKEILADYIVESSARSRSPRVNVNCGAISSELIDSELFGHRKGSFTGATADKPGKIRQADGGTIFLDEIGELPPDAQVRLLRFLQEGEIMPVGSALPVRVDVRLVAATHRDLRGMVRSGEFRADLYFRLARYPLSLPPLRERGGDLRRIGQEILRTDTEARGTATHLDESAWRALEDYRWPGNVRELQNILIRCAIDAEQTPHGRIVSAQAVRRVLDEQGLGSAGGSSPLRAAGENFSMGAALVESVRLQGIPLRDALERAEAEAMVEAVRMEGKQTAAAELLGCSAQSFSNTKRKLVAKGLWPAGPG